MSPKSAGVHIRKYQKFLNIRARKYHFVKYKEPFWGKRFFFFLDQVALEYTTTSENMRTHRDIKLVTTEIRRNYLVSKPICHTTKFFTDNLLVIEKKKLEILVNKPVF